MSLRERGGRDSLFPRKEKTYKWPPRFPIAYPWIAIEGSDGDSTLTS